MSATSAIDPARYERVKALFFDACDLPPADRASLLERACAGDAALRAEVEALLANADRPLTDYTAVPELGEAAAATSHIGPYRVLHEIGRGGMGVVSLAQREGDPFRRRVAVKVLKRGMTTADVVRRFYLERQVLALLDHPGIARLYSAGETSDGRPYLVMEYAEGLDVVAYCDTNRLSVEERLQLFRRICAAVDHAHRSLVVHCDLKPSNIIIREDGEPKLLDFGIATLLGEAGRVPAQDADRPSTSEGRLMTPRYASPEQRRGEPVGTPSDIYTLGVLLYEILTGRLPCSGGRDEPDPPTELSTVLPSVAVRRAPTAQPPQADETPPVTRATAESIAHARATRPDRLARALAGDVDNIVMKAMRENPGARYASAAMLADDIQRHLDGMPILARPPALGYRVSKFVRRHRVGFGAAVAVTIALAAGAAATTFGWLEADARQREAVEASRSAIRSRDRAAEAMKSAERRLDEVRSLARALVVDGDALLRNVEGSAEARQLIVTTVLDYLDRLAPTVDGREQLALELADLYDRVGDIQGQGEHALGDRDGALRSYRAALDLRDRAGAHAAVADSHERIAAILRATGRLDEARKEMRKAAERRLRR